MLLLLFGVTAAVVVLDQVTKFLAFKHDQPFILIKGLIEIVHTRNDGIAFGLGAGMKYGALVWSILSLLTVLLLLFFYAKYTHRRIANTIAFGLIIGGAIGNLIDRIATNGKVLDFIQLSFIKWPSFNIADTAIVIGVIMMVFTIALDHAEEEGNKKSENPAKLHEL